MLLPQRKFREIFFLLLYSEDLIQGRDESTKELVMEQLKVKKAATEEAFLLVDELSAKKDLIDEKIRSASKEYRLERISPVERNILRLAVFEIFFKKEEIPREVVFSEAVRLSRKFGTPESARFVNAILDVICKEKKCD